MVLGRRRQRRTATVVELPVKDRAPSSGRICCGADGVPGPPRWRARQGTTSGQRRPDSGRDRLGGRPLPGIPRRPRLNGSGWPLRRCRGHGSSPVRRPLSAPVHLASQAGVPTRAIPAAMLGAPGPGAHLQANQAQRLGFPSLPAVVDPGSRVSLVSRTGSSDTSVPPNEYRACRPTRTPHPQPPTSSHKTRV